MLSAQCWSVVVVVMHCLSIDGDVSVPEDFIVIELQNGLCWKESYTSSSSNPPAMGRDTFHFTRLLKASSNLALNTSREGASTTSLGNLFQCLTILKVKNFSFVVDLNLLCFSLKPLFFVLSLHALVKSSSPVFL